MTPLEFLEVYEFDKRIVRGDYFPSDPLPIEEGDKVGVVMMNLGGPETPEDVEPFLYNLFMDPAFIDFDLPLWGDKQFSLNWILNKTFGGYFRHKLAKLISSSRAEEVGEDYKKIGGGSPINRLTREQAHELEDLLNDQYAEPTGASFHTYIAMRAWHPFSEEAAAQMEEDGIDKVVLLPLYPQYSKTTTGSSIVYWKALEEAGEIPEWPTTLVKEYAANPRFIQAVSERIDEGLQRFPEEVRSDVHLLFSAHGTPIREMRERRDPYCCLTHSSVDQVMRLRDYDLPYHTAFQSKVGPVKWLQPSTIDKLEELGEQGHEAVLIVPIAFVTDHVETSFELDIEAREEAEEFGIEHFEVTSGLNSHPLFIEALMEATVAQLDLPDELKRMQYAGDGAPSDGEYPLRPLDEMPRFPSEEREARCEQCERVTEARCWTTSCDPKPVREATLSEDTVSEDTVSEDTASED